MLGASRVAQQNLVSTLNARYDAGAAEAFSVAGEQLLEVTNVLERERILRATLADPAISADSKRQTIDALFSHRVSPLAVELLELVATSRWSSDSDMVDAVEESGVILTFMAAEASGRIDTVEEELFRFARAIDANADLQMALTNPATAGTAKAGIVHSLLDAQAAPETTAVLAHVAESLRGRRIQTAVNRLSELAAARRGRVVADVTSAIELSASQEERLAGALARIHGRSVELNVNVDPDVIGGIEVRIGDEVIDGTAASKLEQARRRLSH